MKQVALALLLALALAAVGYSYLNSQARQADAPEPSTSDTVVTAQEPIPVPVVPTERVEPAAFEIDNDRLYDVSYLVDPDVVAYAESLDVTPECVIAIARGEAQLQEKGRVSGQGDVCDHISIRAHAMRYDTGVDYYDLSREQLEVMAETDAHASFDLGRRYINSGEPDKATAYFERAVALSGKATTIMMIRQTDVHPDVLRYELLLVAEALGRRPQELQREMALNGLLPDQIEEAKQRAQERLERLTALRQELVGRPWGES